MTITKNLWQISLCLLSSNRIHEERKKRITFPISNPRFQEPNSPIERIRTPGPAKWVANQKTHLRSQGIAHVPLFTNVSRDKHVHFENGKVLARALRQAWRPSDGTRLAVCHITETAGCVWFSCQYFPQRTQILGVCRMDRILLPPSPAPKNKKQNKKPALSDLSFFLQEDGCCQSWQGLRYV